MEKKRLTRILSGAPRQQVLELAGGIEAGYKVRVVRPAAKTLVMIQVKEPVKESRFYLGETVAVHCSVQVEDTIGVSVVMGDDHDRAKAMAVLDAAHTARLPEFGVMLPRLEGWEAEQISARRKEAARHQKTKVEFRILEDNAT